MEGFNCQSFEHALGGTLECLPPVTIFPFPFSSHMTLHDSPVNLCLSDSL